MAEPFQEVGQCKSVSAHLQGAPAISRSDLEQAEASRNSQPRQRTNAKSGEPEGPQDGNDLVLSGTFSGFRVAYLGTERELGVIVEIFSGPPDADAKPDASSV